MGFFYLKWKMYELKIYRGVICHDHKEWCKIGGGIDLSCQNWHEEFDKFWPKHTKIYIWWHWRLMQNLKENWFVLSKMTWRICQIFVHRLKNSDFILERKMAELSKNKNSKQPDRPDAMWKLYFTLEINE